MGVLEFFDILTFADDATAIKMAHQIGNVAQLVRASSLYLEGSGFKSHRSYKLRILDFEGTFLFCFSFIKNRPVGSLTLQVPFGVRI